MPRSSRCSLPSCAQPHRASRVAALACRAQAWYVVLPSSSVRSRSLLVAAFLAVALAVAVPAQLAFEWPLSPGCVAAMRLASAVVSRGPTMCTLV